MVSSEWYSSEKLFLGYFQVANAKGVGNSKASRAF